MLRAEGVVASGATLWVEGPSSRPLNLALEAAAALGAIWSVSLERVAQAREELRNQPPPDLWILAGLAEPLLRLRLIRRKAPQTLVHVLGANADPVSEAAILDSGADGFSASDTDQRTLLARLKCLLRRAALSQQTARAWPDVEVNTRRCTLRVGDKAFDFSRREIEILSVLCSRLGEWVSREQVLDAVMGSRAKQGSSLLRTHILNIRRKLGPQEWLVQTDRSHGVMLALAVHQPAAGPCPRAP
jgi:DNA-binding response OmpR family regulator